MTHILHLDSSPRGDRSISRTLTKDFVIAWKKVHPDDPITYRDLGRCPVPPIDEAWIAAAFTPPDQITPEVAAALHLSDQLIDELIAADLYVIGIPMYNYSVPAHLKAYIDQVVRVRRTFMVDDEGYKGLLKDKKAVIITTRGGSYTGSPFDFQEPFLRAIFELMGITDITFIHAEHLSDGAEARQQSLAFARAAIQQFIANYSTSQVARHNGQ